MKHSFPFLTIAAAALTLASCGNSSESLTTYTEAELQQSMTIRAAALGYDSADEYAADVKLQCANGNHINCDLCTNGTHTPCADCNHEGRHKNGSHHAYCNHYGWEKGKHYGWQNCTGACDGTGKGKGNGKGNNN